MADNNQMKEILAKLDEGVKSLFESGKYAEYLSVMSRFHNYSTRNTLLIFAQFPKARHVAGYQAWRNNFNRQVKKGERGIKILAPMPFAETKDFEKLDPETKQPILDDDGNPVMETLMRMGARFKTVTVFDYQQTEGEPLPELIEPLTGDVEQYELFLDALRAVSPLPISIEAMPSDTDGTCYFGDRLVIRAGMSQKQTVSAIIHEMAHAKMHDANSLDTNGKPKPKNVEEIEAESVSYVVCQRFSVETGANSFGYVGTWLKNAESKDLQNSLDTIRKAAAELIDGIDEKYRALAKERGIDLTSNPQRTTEMSVEQNYNMIDGVINNEPPKPEQEQSSDISQTDPIRERLSALSQVHTPDEKYEIAFTVLVEALCSNEELLAIAATGAGWQRGIGRKALFDGGYYETLIDTYNTGLADLLADKSMANRLNNTVKGEAYRRLDAIAYDRYILDEYADITKSGRLETYETPYPETMSDKATFYQVEKRFEDSENIGVFVHLTEQLTSGGVHDYGAIFSYDPNDNRDHSINNYLSLKSFATLRESVFGKPESTITLNYKETEPVGSTVLRRLLYTDGMFNRDLKRTRVDVLPPMGKYSVYAQHLSGVIGDDTLIHVGTDSGYLLPLGVSRTRFEEQFVEAQIDSIFEKAPKLLDNALANPEQFARYDWGAITGRISEIEEHNAPVRKLLDEKDKVRLAEAAKAEKEEKRQKAEKYDSRIDEIATAIGQGKPIPVGYKEYEFDGKNPVLDLFKLYGIEIPLRTQGWVNTGLAEITDSGYRYYSSKHKGNSTTFSGYLSKLREAIKAEPIDVKRRRSAELNNEIENGGENVKYSELQEKGFEIAKKYEHLSLKERLDIIAGTFGVKSASIYVEPCRGKYRGQSDIMLKLEGGGTMGIGMRSNAIARKDSTISECVNNTLAKYNPEIVAETKVRASAALKAREAEDNYNAEQRGLKPYKFLNVELCNGGADSGHTGWYYATIAVDNKVIGFITSDLASDIARGELTEYVNRANYFVAGGLKDEEADFVFNNVGHSSVKDAYTVEMSAEVRERAEKTLVERNTTVPKQAAKRANTVPHQLYEQFEKLSPQILSGEYSYMKLESKGYEPLSIECIGDNRISVMHTYQMNGDLMYDPMITFQVDRDAKTLTAVEFEQSMPPLYQRVEENGNGRSIDGNGRERNIAGLQAQINNFSAQWFQNISEQGFMPVKANLVFGEDNEVQITFDKDGKPIMPKAEKAIEPTLSPLVPDPTVTYAEMSAYGYTYEDMLPLSINRALELFDKGETVYLLYNDGTEGMAIERSEIESFDGIFGIERIDWEKSREFAALKDAAVNADERRETDLLYGDTDKFGIYQIKNNIDEAHNLRFAPMRELEALGLSVDRANYELIYTGTLTEKDTLDRLYATFNTNHPADFTGHSLSVSDVVVLQKGGNVSSHFVDSIGFKELPNFTGSESEQPKTAEREPTSDKPTFYQVDKRSSAPKGKPDFLAKIEANKQRVAQASQPTQKTTGREVE